MNIKGRKTGALPTKSLIGGDSLMINQLDARRSGNKRSTGLVGAHRRAVHFSQGGVEGKIGPD